MGKLNSCNGRRTKFIFLTGAGSSCDIGYPSLDDLMGQVMMGNDPASQLIREVLNSLNGQRYEKAIFEEIIAHMKTYIKVTETLRNDHVLRTIINNIPYNILDGQVVARFRDALIKCYRILVDSYGPHVIRRDGKEFKSMTELFLSISEIAPAFNIYTTNYDCTYQVMASDCDRLSFMSHIDNQDGQFREMAWYNIRKDLADKKLPELFIHRLHGCVAWFNLTDADGGTGLTSERLGAGGRERMQIPDEELSTMCIKLVASQLLGTNRTFASAFDEMAEHLKEINTLIVWGYSFRDLEVTRLINQALLAAKTPFRIYYIDPFLTEYSARNNILKTLKGAPIQISEDFMPVQVEWTPTDGREVLIAKVTNIITEAESCQSNPTP